MSPSGVARIFAECPTDSAPLAFRCEAPFSEFRILRPAFACPIRAPFAVFRMSLCSESGIARGPPARCVPVPRHRFRPPHTRATTARAEESARAAAAAFHT
jgi:hypothetical protein